MNHALARCSAPGSACHLLHLEADGARTVWAVLEAASEARFSGRITLALTEPVDVHVLLGEVYLAERDSAPDLGQRLVDLGVLDPAQLERGTVRVGGTAHLGRLLDRVPEIDPHRIELALEMFSDDALAPVMDQVVGHIDVAHRAHHPSGCVRWVTGQRALAPAAAPISPATGRDELIAPDAPAAEAAPAVVVDVVPPPEPTLLARRFSDTIADPEPLWLRSLEPVARLDEPVVTSVPELEPAPVAPVLGGRPSIPAPPAAPLHDLLADLDLSSILAKVASTDGPPMPDTWVVGVVATPPVPGPAQVETDVRYAVDAALAGIEAATRRDEVVDQYVTRRPAPTAPAPAPALAASPTLAPAPPSLPIAPTLPIASPAPPPPPAPAPALSAPVLPVSAPTVQWADTPAFTSLTLNEGIPSAPHLDEDAPNGKSGGFRRLIGGGSNR